MEGENKLIKNKKILITETILRDAHQSLMATRMPIEDMIPILEDLDNVGFYSLECWGGATFDACLRFLNEDPWERLRKIKSVCKKTKLQMLFRGQNMLGYRHYADDVVEYFVQRAAYNGIDIIRVFDALNDINNLKTSIKAAKKENIHAQVAISYTTGPIFTHKYFVEYAKQIADMGADSICIKDMAALLTPYETNKLVAKIKETVNLPIQIHTHYTSGLASMCIIKGVEAGADIVDTAMSPLALGTSLAPTESIVAAFSNTMYDTGIDLSKLSPIRDYFMKLRQKYIEKGLIDTRMLTVDAKSLIYQVPGGMLSNLLSQLKQAGKEDKFNEVLEEVPKVRSDTGYPPLVTPTSQIVGTQAVYNIIMGERYKMCTNEFKSLVSGKYGKTPMPIDKDFKLKIIGDQEIINCRPADLIDPELSGLREEISPLMEQEEDVLSYAQFPKVAKDFFKKRRDRKYSINSKIYDSKKKIHPF